MNVKVDIKFIKGILSEVGIRAIEALKIAVKLPYFKTYLLIAIVMTFLFTVLTFPYNELIKSKIKELEKGSVNSIDIGELEYKIFGQSSADSIGIVTSPGKEIFIDSITIDDNFNPYSIFISKDFNGSFELQTVSFKSSNVDFISSLNCEYSADFNEYSISGIKNAQIKMMFGKSNLTLSDITLPAGMGGLPLNIPPMEFSSIQSNILLNSGILRFEKFTVFGSQLSATISGTITLNRVFSRSKLDVSISIDPESTAIEPYKDFLTSYTNADGKIVLPLEGTISHPQIKKKTE